MSRPPVYTFMHSSSMETSGMSTSDMSSSGTVMSTMSFHDSEVNTKRPMGTPTGTPTGMPTRPGYEKCVVTVSGFGSLSVGSVDQTCCDVFTGYVATYSARLGYGREGDEDVPMCSIHQQEHGFSMTQWDVAWSNGYYGVCSGDLPAPWAIISTELGWTSCVVPEGFGTCIDDPDLLNTGDDAAFEAMRRYICNNWYTCGKFLTNVEATGFLSKRMHLDTILQSPSTYLC